MATRVGWDRRQEVLPRRRREGRRGPGRRCLWPSDRGARKKGGRAAIMRPPPLSLSVCLHPLVVCPTPPGPLAFFTSGSDTAARPPSGGPGGLHRPGGHGAPAWAAGAAARLVPLPGRPGLQLVLISRTTSLGNSPDPLTQGRTDLGQPLFVAEQQKDPHEDQDDSPTFQARRYPWFISSRCTPWPDFRDRIPKSLKSMKRATRAIKVTPTTVNTFKR